MPSVQAPTSLNNLTTDGVYVFVQPPAPQAGVGVPTNLAGIVGAAAWGPLNQAVVFSDAASCYLNYGPITLEPYSLVAEAYLASVFNNNFLGVRVSDGSDLASTAVIKDSGATNTGITVTAKYTGTVGNTISVQLAQGSLGAAYVTVTVNRTGYPPEIYPNITGTANALWVNIAAALNNGISGVRPKSNYVTATAGTGTLGITPATTTLSKGSNGSSGAQITISGTTGVGPTVGITINGTVLTPYTYIAGDTSASIAATDIATNLNANAQFNTSYSASASGAVITISPFTAIPPFTLSTQVTGGAIATVNQASGAAWSTAGSVPQIGVDGTTGRTGIYALRGTGVGQFILAGNSDSTVYATLATFAASEGCLGIVTFPSGTSSTAAVTAKGTQSSQYLMFLKDWVYFYDPVNNQQRLVSPLGTALGLVASLPPEASPGNKPVGGISSLLSTERTGTPYSISELGQLEQAGITLITSPISRGGVLGIFNGQNANANTPGQDTVAYTRMTNYVAYALASLVGPYVGELQGTAANDQTRAAARATIEAFLNYLQLQNRISASSVTLNTVNNTPTTIGQGYMIATVMVQYLAVVKFFVVNLQGGSTVQIQVGTGQVA